MWSLARRSVFAKARKLRLEFPGACYHVINRGNRRVGPFGGAKTRGAFEDCLFEACVRSKWVLHAYVIMGNHFHLALETPDGNLASGMQDHDLTASARAGETGGAREVRRVRCEERLKAALRVVGESQADPAAAPKGAPPV